jgi:hypothetical protein
MSKIFGGSKSKSESSNRSYDELLSAYRPLINQATGANQSALALLGGDSTGFDAYKDATGFDFELQRGLGALQSDAATRGIFRSGARDKAIMEYGNNLQNSYAQNYINSLLGISGQGLQAGGVLAGAGGRSTATSSSNRGLASLIGGAGALAAGGK